MSQTKAQLIDPVDGSLVNADINASAAIAGTKISPDFGSQAITTTGTVNTTLLSSAQTGTGGLIKLARTGTANGEYLFKMLNDSGNDCSLVIRDEKAGASRFTIDSNGTVDVAGNLDVGAGLDVTGAITSTGTLTIENAAPGISLNDTNSNPDWQVKNENGLFRIRDITSSVNRLTIASGGQTVISGNLDCSSGVDVTGNITVTGTVDGVDIAALNTTVGNITTDLVTDTSPQLGGDLDFNGNNALLQGAGGNVNSNWDNDAWEKILFDNSYNQNPQGPNKIVLQDDTNWKAGLGVAANEVGMYTGGDIAFYSKTTDSTASTKETLAKFIGDGAVELYHNNNKKFETTDNGASVTGGLAVNPTTAVTGSYYHYKYGVNGGTAGDRSLTVTGNEAAIEVLATDGGDHAGSLIIRGNNDGYGFINSSDNNRLEIVSFAAAGGDWTVHGAGNNVSRKDFCIVANQDGAVELYHNNGKKFQTTSDGFETGSGFSTTGSAGGVRITAGSLIQTSENSTGFRYAARFYNPNGQVGYISTQNSATHYATSSDYRLKENEVAISDGITRLKTLKPYRFNFKANASETVDGFFAHEVTAVPEAITGTKDEVDSNNNPVYQGIDQSKLVPLLTAALQEAVAKIEVLETKVAALEAA